MVSISKENYLKAIWELVQDGHPPIGARLADALNVSAPAVSLALRRLARDGYIKLDKHGTASLTREGREVAEGIVRRHRLVERLLTDVLGMEWYKVHDEAERLEHAISHEVEQRLVEYFGERDRCPHGYPIAATRNASPALKVLKDAEPDTPWTIVRVYEKDRRFMEYLDGLGLHPGQHVIVRDRGYDGTLTIVVDGRAVPLGVGASERIWVSREPEARGAATGRGEVAVPR